MRDVEPPPPFWQAQGRPPGYRPYRPADARFHGPPAETVADIPVSRERRVRVLHPLTFILALQAVLSVILVRSNTIFGDEADYLWIGGTLIGHILHGTDWPTVHSLDGLSGSPFIYPPLGALVNAAGGIVAARLLSLFFMLCATAFGYATANRLYGRACAISAAVLFSLFSPTLQIGAFATFDALSVSLTACAVWVGVRAAYSRRRWRWVLAAASAVILAVAETAAYSGVVMIPVTIVFIGLAWITPLGVRRAIFGTAGFSLATMAFFAGILTVTQTWTSIMDVVIGRHAGATHDASQYASVAHIFNDSWTYSGLIALAALIGVITAIASGNRVEAVQVGYLAAVAFVIPLAQAHASTAVSLKKHLAYGAIFATIAAGYGIRRISGVLPGQRWAAIACGLVAATFPAVNGFQQSYSWYHTWQNSSSLIAQLGPRLTENSPVTVDLTEASFLCDYYRADLGNLWETCNTSLTTSDITAARPEYIVLGYPVSALPGDAPQSPLAAQSQSLGAWARDPETREAGEYGELAKLTTALEENGRYRLIATGPYNDAAASSFYAIWERNSLPPVKAPRPAKKK
jgi:hypothetical protein